jgi:prephenate dehydrogenase
VDNVTEGTAFGRIAIIGVGLIGGSLARAVRRNGRRTQIIGYGRNHLNLQRAVELGVIDRFETRLQDAVVDADLVVIAVPVGATAAVLRELAPHLGGETIVTDVGSTKASVVNDARAQLGAAFSRFVPGHPIAGNERAGIEATSAELFEGRSVLLTPVAETNPAAVAQVRALWESTGAQVLEMTPEYHDCVLAATSHLPHVLAYALVEALSRTQSGEEIFKYSAGGFRDFTRIASSDPVMWRDICLANRTQLLTALDGYRAVLDELSMLIRSGEGEKLIELFRHAKTVRDRNIGKNQK